MVAFYGVFDGHGGRAAAEFLRENLMKNVIENENFMSDPERALKEAFLRTDEDFYGAAPGETSGSTGLAACVIGGKLYIANAGDCRAVLSRKGKAIDLSQDQKPSSQGELERIKRRVVSSRTDTSTVCSASRERSEIGTSRVSRDEEGRLVRSPSILR